MDSLTYRMPTQISTRGVVVSDKDHVIRYTDSMIAHLLDVDQSDLLGKDLMEAARSTIRHRFSDPDAYELRCRRLMENPWESSEDVVERTGDDWRVLHIYSTPLLGQEGQPVGRVEVYSDITKRRRLEEENTTLYRQVRSAYEELKATQEQLLQAEKLRAVGEIASGVAHDFNNTLGIILGNVQLLLRTVDDAKAKSRLRSVEQAVLDGAETVRRIQEFTRIQPEDVLCPLDLNSMASTVVEMMRPGWDSMAERKRIQIGVDLRLGRDALAVGVGAEIREVLTNVLLNAVQAMPDGGRVEVTTGTGDGYAYVRVTDGGIGMSEEARRRVFEPFFTTKGVEGTGLGMSVAYGIMKRHRGKLDVESRLGRGTTVSILLPRANGELASPTEGCEPFAQYVEPARILVVDDEAMFAEVLVDMLRQFGHDVRVAGSGEEALSIFDRGRFDLVFTDLGMPGMSGWQVAEAVRRVDASVPVVLLTGWGAKVDSDRIASTGIVSVLSKPVNMQNLSAAVAGAVSRNRSGQGG